jgi:hypothetical protein
VISGSLSCQKHPDRPDFKRTIWCLTRPSCATRRDVPARSWCNNANRARARARARPRARPYLPAHAAHRDARVLTAWRARAQSHTYIRLVCGFAWLAPSPPVVPLAARRGDTGWFIRLFVGFLQRRSWRVWPWPIPDHRFPDPSLVDYRSGLLSVFFFSHIRVSDKLKPLWSVAINGDDIDMLLCNSVRSRQCLVPFQLSKIPSYLHTYVEY